MINVLIVDDHKLFRYGIKVHLDKDDRYRVVGEANNGKEAIEFIRPKKVDVVILDIVMPVMNGIDCAKEIKSRYPLTKILCLTIHNEHNYIKKMIEAGATGYLLKNCSEQELKRAIDAVFDDQPYYSQEVTGAVMKSLRKDSRNLKSPDAYISLTKRELEVLSLIMKEYSNKEIALELGISHRTVDAHKQNLMDKTNSKNVAGLVLHALRNKLFEE